MQDITRSQIVAEARSWIGTRWKHQGRLKGDGVDCVGLAYQIGNSFKRFGVPPPALPPYARTATDNLMVSLCDQFLIRKKEMRIGMVVAMRFDITTRHMGILGDYGESGLSLIHAYAVNRQVVEHRLDDAWRSRIFACYDFPQVIDA